MARKATFLLALIWIVSPVAGLRPIRAARLRTCRIPSPVIFTRSPFLRCLAIMLTTSTRAFACACAAPPPLPPPAPLGECTCCGRRKHRGRDLPFSCSHLIRTPFLEPTCVLRQQLHEGVKIGPGYACEGGAALTSLYRSGKGGSNGRENNAAMSVQFLRAGQPVCRAPDERLRPNWISKSFFAWFAFIPGCSL